jgi:hypothetical protein
MGARRTAGIEGKKMGKSRRWGKGIWECGFWIYRQMPRFSMVGEEGIVSIPPPIPIGLSLYLGLKYNSLFENLMLISKFLKTSVPINPFIPKSA